MKCFHTDKCFLTGYFLYLFVASSVNEKLNKTLYILLNEQKYKIDD